MPIHAELPRFASYRNLLTNKKQVAVADVSSRWVLVGLRKILDGKGQPDPGSTVEEQFQSNHQALLKRVNSYSANSRMSA